MAISSTVSDGAQVRGRNVLISGASFAGLATAFWLNRLGYVVTVIDSAPGVRRGGTPVDIKGETIPILERMGLFEAVHAKALPPRAFAFKDAQDKTLGTIGRDSALADQGPDQAFEVHRDALLDILLAAVEGSAEILFERSITGLAQHADGVAVTLSDGSRHDYALVLGCDGNRSNTRKLAFGVGDDASYFMGAYFYLKVVDDTGLLPANTSEVFSEPGRTAMLNGYDDRTDLCLVFRTDGEIDYDHRDQAQVRRLLHDHFDGVGWKVPQILSYVDRDGDLYFDRVNQIRLPRWSRGRVALVGDAGYCVSPVAGMGGSMALIGATHLADAMRRHPDDHTAAFGVYEDGLRGFVEDVQEEAATNGMALIFPADDRELAQRDRQIAANEVSL